MTATINAPKQPKYVEPGQRWTFEHSSGKRTEYVVVDPTDLEQMADQVRARLWARYETEEHPHGIVYLLNEITGKYAMVTRFWLRRRLPEGQSRWLPPAQDSNGTEAPHA